MNHKTRQTTWDDPGPLGAGCRTGITHRGRIFYINDMLSNSFFTLHHDQFYI